jgi:hypothetical protein
MIISNFQLPEQNQHIKKTDFASVAKSVSQIGTVRSGFGPLATYFTWLQADRPNHHEQRLDKPVGPLRQS